MTKRVSTLRVFTLLSILLLGCAAARAQGLPPCQPNQPTPTDAAFWADVPPMPEGTGSLSYSMDLSQEKDAASPVFIRSMMGVSSQQHRGGKIRCVELENRSARTVRAVQLAWAVTARDVAEKKILARGRLPTVEVQVAPGARQTAELREASFAGFLLPLVQKGIHAGDHHVSLSVARVEFTDGSVVDADEPR
ncbi:MAG TPA: hypothetical protein VN228_20410 [Pyrinomonadaceae bacterium]|nr:hypothetical protein [Pyrinomonadaceae bacterium]